MENGGYVTREEFDRFRQQIGKQLDSVSGLETEVKNMALDVSNKLDTISKDIKDSQKRQGERIGELEKHQIEYNYKFKEIDKIGSKLDELSQGVITKQSLSVFLDPFSVRIDSISSDLKELKDSKKNMVGEFIKNTIGIIVAVITAYLVFKLGLK